MINSNAIQADQIHSLQQGIIKYLNVSQFASWSILKKNINSLFVTRYGNEANIPGNLEYEVLYPLLRAGLIETARRPETDKLVYCCCRQALNHADKNIQASLTLLKRIPSLHTIITHWHKSETEVHYIYERFEKNHFKTARDTLQPNIYTSRDRVYSNKYIRLEDGTLYLIPEIEDNVDAFNIAHCCIESIKGHSHFAYHKNSNELTCRTFNSMLPIVICRALILSDPKVLDDNTVYNRGRIIIREITDDHIKELKRIFGETAVEVQT